MGVSQNFGYHFGVPLIRIIVFWGLYRDPPILGNYHIYPMFYLFEGDHNRRG